MDESTVASPDLGQSGEGNQIVTPHDDYSISHDFVTVYTSTQPCNKSYVIGTDGKSEKAKKQVSFFGGIAIKRHVSTLETLARIIKEISENPCKCLGLGFHPSVPVDVPYQIISKSDSDKALKQGSIIPDGDLYKDVKTKQTVACRLKANMSPSSYVLFDKDEGNGDIEQWIVGVASFVPGFDIVDKIIIPSNSSRVWMDDGKYHIYVKIIDSMDTYDLKDRMLSAGHAAGHCVDKISKDGKELSRIIVDVSVFSPERIIYDCKPTINGSDGSIIKPVDVAVKKGSISALDTTLVKAVDGYGAFTKKKDTTIDAQGNKQDRTLSKVNGIFNNTKLKNFTPIEMKLAGKVVTKTIQEVIDENLIERYGDCDGKIRCQATFDDRDSKSFNGILRYGADGKPHLYDNGSGITYKLGKTTEEMFKDVPGFCVDELIADGNLETLISQISNISITGSNFKPTINELNIKNAWHSTFQNPNNNKIIFLNKNGNIVSFVEYKALGALKETFGFFVEFIEDDEIRKQVDKILTLIFFKFLGLYRQRDKLNFVVDIFAEKAGMTMRDDCVDVVLLHQPFHVDNFDLAIVGDFKAHWPDFDLFLRVLCASRFANDRRQAFLWLHAPSDWGKGFLVAILEELGIVTELCVKEIEKALEGAPFGKTADAFLKSWILHVDEFKTVKSELKQLNNKISASPKNQLSFTAPLYLKLFASAEGVDSLAGSEGVESQFANRFSYMNPKTGKLDDRPLFDSDKGLYLTALVNYTGGVLNRFVEDMKAKGGDKAAKYCDKILAEFNKEFTIANEFGLLDDSVNDLAEEVKQILIEFGKKPVGALGLNKNLNQQLMSNTVIGEHAKLGRVIVLKASTKFIKDWIDTKVDDSQKYTLRHKATQIAEMASEGGLKTTLKLKHEKALKGVMVKLDVPISFI